MPTSCCRHDLTLEREDIGGAARPADGGHAPRAPPVGGRATTSTSSPTWPSGWARRRLHRGARRDGQWLRTSTSRRAPALQRVGHEAPDFDRFWARGELRPAAAGRRRRHPAPPSATTPKAGRCPRPAAASDHSSRASPLRPCRLPRPPGLAAARRSAGRPPPAVAGLQPAGDTAAQPARLRRAQPVQAPRARGAAAAPRRRRRPRHRRRRHRAPVQRARRLPGRRRASATTCARAWCSCPPAPGTTRARRPAAASRCCVHGNPNVLTRDVGTSSLAQGCTGPAHGGAGGTLGSPAADAARLRRAGGGLIGGAVSDGGAAWPRRVRAPRPAPAPAW
jgi:biotin/methionine sulfoxide reductase